MKEIRTKLIAVAVLALFAVSATACEAAKPDGGTTTTTTVSDNSDSSSSDAAGENSDASADDESAVSEAPVPEKDDDGSKISVVEVTDAAGSAVTDAASKPVTELVIVDDKGTVVTDAKGQNAKPNIKPAPAVTKVADSIGTPPKMTDAPQDINGVKIENASYGPTLTLSSAEAKAGDTVQLKINITDNAKGFTALMAYVDANSEYFEIIESECNGGDRDAADYKRSQFGKNMTVNAYDKGSIVYMFFDSQMKQAKDDGVFATVTLKVKEGTPAGKYDITFNTTGDGGAMGNNIEEGSSTVQIISPKYVNGSVTVTE